MGNISLFFSLGKKFFLKYYKSYFLLYFKYFAICIVGVLLNVLIAISPLILIITLPLAFWAMWKTFVVHFTIIPTCYDFIKKGGKRSFKEIFESIDTKNLLAFITYCCFIVFFLWLPQIIVGYISMNIKNAALSFTIYSIAFLATILLSIPFYVLYLQAFYFKTDDESYFDVFKNCYKKFDSSLVITILAIIALSIVAGLLPPIINIVAMIALALFNCSVVTFWYISKLGK